METLESLKETSESLKKEGDFYCEQCDYLCFRKYDFKKHISTIKHKNQILETKIETLTSRKGSKKKDFDCHCGKVFLSKSGLWKHTKMCISSSPPVMAQQVDMAILNDKDIILELIKQNQEFKELIIDQTNKLSEQNKQMIEIAQNPKFNNCNNNSNNKITNNRFNLNVFLNETCKDAMNINDFVEGIKISLTDLENVGSLGYVEGITKIILNNLKQLDITKRPIHCSDIKREIIHIKDNNAWEKEEEEKTKLNNVIKTITNKNIRMLPEWKTANPHYRDTENKLNDTYMKIVNESMGGCNDEKDEKNYNKIIKKIAQETTIEK